MNYKFHKCKEIPDQLSDFKLLNYYEVIKIHPGIFKDIFLSLYVNALLN
jgi:hypothetical protein